MAKIVIDVSSLPYGTGVSRYSDNLVRQLASLPSQHRFVLWAGTARQFSFFKSWWQSHSWPENFRLRLSPLPPTWQLKLWNQWYKFSPEWLVGEFDLWHSLDWSLPPSSSLRMLTVHDLYFFSQPEVQKHPFYQPLLQRLVLARKARLPVIAVSQATAEDLIQLLDYPKNLIKVIYEGVDQSWFEYQPEPESWQQIKQTYDLNTNYYVFVGTQDPRKNLKRILAAWQEFSTQHPTDKLLLVGKSGWEKLADLPAGVVATGWLNEEQLKLVLARAQALISPHWLKVLVCLCWKPWLWAHLF